MGSLFSSCYARLDSQTYALGALGTSSPDIVANSPDELWRIRGVFDRDNYSLYIQFLSMKTTDFSYSEEHKQKSLTEIYGPGSVFVHGINCAQKVFIPATNTGTQGEFNPVPNDHFGIWYFKFAKTQQIPSAELIKEKFLAQK